jgi:SAM-dependent methyltransferase
MGDQALRTESAELVRSLAVPLPTLWGGLERRTQRPEVMDQPELDANAHQEALRGLARINALTRTIGCFAPAVRRLARCFPGRPLRVLDVACGGGDTVRELVRLGRREGLALEVHGCDLSPEAVALASRTARAEGLAAQFFEADALGAPLPGGYQLITCSLFLHHLGTAEAESLLRRMAAATEAQLLVHDLVRSRLDLLLTWAGTRLLSRSPVVHVDGPLSVGGAFRIEEVRALAAAAGLDGAELRRFWPERFLLSWCRPDRSAGEGMAAALQRAAGPQGEGSLAG